MKTKLIFILFLIAFFLHGDESPTSAAENAQNRIRFQITTISESAGERKILAQTTIEGLPGTDFNINLQAGNFKMQTKFLSDIIAPDKLKIRAQLDTKRFYGNSPANLPLYEEDSQKQSFEIGFDEKVVLLPFGRGGNGETLKIEITPSLLAASKEEAAAPIKINFEKQIPSGEISIEASKIPHRFTVEAALLANGQEVARGSADCLFAEEKEIILQPERGADPEIINQPFAARIKIDKFNRSRPKDLAGIVFDVYRKKAASGNDILPIGNSWSGIGTLDGELTYPLESESLPKDKNYEIKFIVRLASD